MSILVHALKGHETGGKALKTVCLVTAYGISVVIPEEGAAVI